MKRGVPLLIVGMAAASQDYVLHCDSVVFSFRKLEHDGRGALIGWTRPAKDFVEEDAHVLGVIPKSLKRRDIIYMTDDLGPHIRRMNQLAELMGERPFNFDVFEDRQRALTFVHGLFVRF